MIYQNVGERIIANSVLYYGDCWVWLGKTCASRFSDNRYGRMNFRIDGKHITLMAHRVSYEYFNGIIPIGYEVDHKCYNTECVNPAHLQAITPKANYFNRRV